MKRVRKWIAVAAGLITVAGAPVAGLAAATRAGVSATGTGGSSVRCLDFAYRTTPVTTSSTTFTNVPGLRVDLASIFGQAVSVNLVLAGAEVQVRATATDAGGTRILRPGVAQLDPTTGRTRAFSFTFVDLGESGAVHGNTIRVQWRVLRGGATATLRRGDLMVLSQADVCSVGSPA
jgi:hypothetical protein